MQYAYQKFSSALKFYCYVTAIIGGIILLFMPSTAMANEATARQLVTEGRAFLVQHDIVNANTRFRSAVTEYPASRTANAFYSVTRILELVYSDDFSNLLNRNNASNEGRDIYDWDVQFPKDVNGNTNLPPTAPISTDYINFLTNRMIPEIDGALQNLTQIDSSFSLILAPKEIVGGDALEVDYGDVLMYRALLYALKTSIKITASYNIGFNVATLLPRVEDDSFSINDDLLAMYVDFLKLLTPDQIESAGTALVLSINNYLDASNFIRTEIDDQENDFIAFDSESLSEEQEFRNILGDIKISLSGPATIGDEELSAPFVLDLSVFFDEPFGLRGFLPHFDEDNNVIPCTFFDPTINGILPDYTSVKWNDILKLSISAEEATWYANGECMSAVGTPSNQSACNYPEVVQPIIQTTPATCKPFAIGDLSTGNLNLQVGLPAFSSGVDIYLAIQSAAMADGALLLIDQNKNILPFTTYFPKWKINNTAAINESLYGNIPISLLPAGMYNLYTLVVPTGETNFSHYYLWTTYFNINY